MTHTDLNKDYTVVSWRMPMATDSIGTPGVYQIQGPSSGSAVKITSNEPVTYEALNSAGVISYCNFSIIVKDLQPPTVNCSSAYQEFNVSNNTNIYNVPLTIVTPLSASDNSGQTPTITYPMNLDVDIGTTLLSTKITDGSGNYVFCNVTVTILDPWPPHFVSCPPPPPPYVTMANDIAGYWPMPVAVDNNRVTSLTSNYAEGTLFNHTTTVVIYTATDPSGNKATCDFNVTVITPAASTGKSSSSSSTIIGPLAGGIAGGVALLALLMVVWYRRMQHKPPANFASIIATLGLDEYVLEGQQGAQRPKDLLRDTITIAQVVGKGNFGVVAVGS